MTRKFDFDSYKIVFNDHHFQGDGHLLGLPHQRKEMYGGRVMVCSRPPHLSYVWLLNLTTHREVVTIYGTMESPDGATIKLQNGVLTSYATGPNTLGLYDYIFAFEVIDPPI